MSKKFVTNVDFKLSDNVLRIALKEVQVESPAYVQGADVWWGEVIRRTALGAGADERGRVYRQINYYEQLR